VVTPGQPTVDGNGRAGWACRRTRCVNTGQFVLTMGVGLLASAGLLALPSSAATKWRYVAKLAGRMEMEWQEEAGPEGT
jgi:hypothetical protein